MNLNYIRNIEVCVIIIFEKIIENVVSASYCCCAKKYQKYFTASMNTGNDPYEDALEEALGKEFCDITEDEILEEFKTDEWWRKRGL